MKTSQKITLTLPSNLLSQTKSIAEESGASISGIIRVGLKKELQRRGIKDESS